MNRPDHLDYFPIDETRRYVNHIPLEWGEDEGYITVTCENPYLLYGAGKSWESAMGELYVMAVEYLQDILEDPSNFAQDLLHLRERVSKLVADVPPCTGLPSTLVGCPVEGCVGGRLDDSLFWWKDEHYHVILSGLSSRYGDGYSLFMYTRGEDIYEMMQTLRSNLRRDYPDFPMTEKPRLCDIYKNGETYTPPGAPPGISVKNVPAYAGGGFSFIWDGKVIGSVEERSYDWVYEGDPEIKEWALDHARRFYNIGPYVDIVPPTKEGEYWHVLARYPDDEGEPLDLCGVGLNKEIAIDGLLEEITKMEARLQILRDQIDKGRQNT